MSYTFTRRPHRTQSCFRTCLEFPFSKVYQSSHSCMDTIDIWVLGLHFNTAANHKRVRLFWTAFAAMFTYEIIPSYIFPLLNGFNIFCLSSQHASPSVQNAFTNIFGGADSNEGLGLFSLSFDWQYIGSGLVPSAGDTPIHADHTVNSVMSLPLIQQANSWIGLFFSYIAIAAIYYSNTWNVIVI
jgi:OPT oligopeptide transporter protein